MATTALLFPGQGSQEPGMGRDLAEADAEAMDRWKQAEAVSGLDLREIYWDGTPEDQSLTRHLQPGLTVVTLNLWARLSGRLKPAMAAGHSLGEYAALCAAGVLSFRDCLQAVSQRGRLMAEADPEGLGSMAAILKLSLAEVELVVDEAARETDATLVIANHNSPSQFVVSGARAAVAAVAVKAKAKKGRAVVLPVSGAFHSPLMEEPAREMAKVLDTLDWSKAAFDLVSGVTAAPERDADALKATMARQMTSPVYWVDACRAMHGAMSDDGPRRFLEVGPKGVLTKLAAQCLAGYEDVETQGLGDMGAMDAFLETAQ